GILIFIGLHIFTSFSILYPSSINQSSGIFWVVAMLLGIFSTIGIILIPAETYTFTDQKKKFLKTDNEIDDAPITNYIIIGIMIIVGIGIVIATLIGLFNRANLNDISEKPSTIKILTYNIHFGYDKNGNKAYYQL